MFIIRAVPCCWNIATAVPVLYLIDFKDGDCFFTDRTIKLNDE